MAAGLGFKDFTTGEVLTAADVDGYLMQGVWVFASAAARDAAVTSPQEGNFAYLKDTNVTTYYTGSAWANLDTTGMTNPMTTTGDTIYSSSGSTPARLGIGSTGNVLTVAGGVPTWAAPASATAMTELATGSLSGASVTISSISGTYRNLELVIAGYSTTGDTAAAVTTNSDTSNYKMAGVKGGDAGTLVIGSSGTTNMLLSFANNPVTQSPNINMAVFTFYEYANSSSKKNILLTSSSHYGGNAFEENICKYSSPTTAAITSLVLNSAGTWSTGTYTLYGVK